jgi:hypothetical protein
MGHTATLSSQMSQHLYQWYRCIRVHKMHPIERADNLQEAKRLKNASIQYQSILLLGFLSQQFPDTIM